MRASLILLVAASNLYTLASAQAPTPLCCMAFTTIESTLYIQGGSARGGSHSNSQFFSLDLTLSGWNTTNPPWKVLPVGAGIHSAPFDYYHAMAATRDNKKLIVWGPLTGLSTYDIVTTVWTSEIRFDPFKGFLGSEVSSALDPTTGLIYFPGVANNATGMLVYDPVTSSTSIVPMYPHSVLSLDVDGYSFVWSELRKSFLLFGGSIYVNDTMEFNQYIAEYQPSTYSWIRIATVGSRQLASHCMVPAYGGTKMVVFGGWQPPTPIPQGEDYSSALYMLDVKSMSWTLLSDGQVTGRRNMACTVVGDNFVTWGGVDSNNEFSPAMVYSLKAHQWVDQYIFTSVEHPSVEHPSSTTPKGQLGIFIGVGVAAAVCLAVLLGWIVFRCRKSRAGQVHTIYKQVPSPSATSSRREGSNTMVAVCSSAAAPARDRVR